MITVQWLKFWVNQLAHEGWKVQSVQVGTMTRFTWRSPAGEIKSGMPHPDQREAFCNALAQVVRQKTELPR